MDSNLNQLAPITDFETAYILAQQAYELGYRGATFPELYNWFKGKLDLTGLSNTAGLPEDFPEPGSTLEGGNPMEWTILGPGSYNKIISGTIIIADDEFGFAQFDGSDFNNVRKVKIPQPIIDKADKIEVGNQKLTSSDLIAKYSLSKKEGVVSINILKLGYVPALTFTDTQGYGISNAPFSSGMGLRFPSGTLILNRGIYSINNLNKNFSELVGKTVEFSFIVQHSAAFTGSITGTFRTNFKAGGYVNEDMEMEVLSPILKKFTFAKVISGDILNVRGYSNIPNFTATSELEFKTVRADYRILEDVNSQSPNSSTIEEMLRNGIPDVSGFATNSSVDSKISTATQGQSANISDKQIKQSFFDLGFYPVRNFTDVNGVVISNEPFSPGDAIKISQGNATGTPTILALRQYADNLNYPVGKTVVFSFIVQTPAVWDGVEMNLVFRYFIGTSYFPSNPVRVTRLSATMRLVEFEHVWLGTETQIDQYWQIKTSVTAMEDLVFKTVASDYYIKSGTETSNTLMVKEIVKAEVESEVEKAIDKTVTTIIKVKSNGNLGEFDFIGNRAIQDAIESVTDASEFNRYHVKVFGGYYGASLPSDFDAEGASVNNLCFIRGKDFVDVELIGNVVIDGSLPDNLGADFNYQFYQTIYWNSNSRLYGTGHIFGKNVRYPIHIDGGPEGLSGFLQNIKGIKVRHLGNEGDAASRFPGSTPVGVGMSQGHTLIYEEVELHAKQNSFYFHTNTNFNAPSKNVLRNSTLITELGGDDISAIRVNSNGSGQNDEFIMEGNSINGGFRFNYFDDWASVDSLNKLSYNHSEIRVKGHGNDPFHFHIDMKGFALKITSRTSGSSSSVRFNPNTSGFQAIIKDKDYGGGSYTDKYGEVNADGYAYRDGGGELKGHAIGRLDIGSDISGAKYIKSLGKRLGNCSVVNKTLEITVDGVAYTVTFDKNYNGTAENAPSSFTNAQIIAEINAVIGSVATVTEYAVGNDYYPELTDRVAVSRNVSPTEAILRGMAVVLDSNRIRKATNADSSIYGIALDDFLPNGYGRVLKEGYIWAINPYRFYALTDTPTTPVDQGVELGISETPGILSRNATIKLFKARENNVISVNAPA